MLIEMGHISRQHVSETLSTQKDLKILRDDTTKKGKHIYGVKLSTNKDTVTEGLREVSQNTSEELFNATATMISDLSMTAGDIDIHNNVISSVSNTMTDRCPTELKVNKMIYKMKRDINSENVNNESSRIQQPECSCDVHEFQCAVHPVLQFETESDRILKSVERQHSTNLKICVGEKRISMPHFSEKRVQTSVQRWDRGSESFEKLFTEGHEQYSSKELQRK